MQNEYVKKLTGKDPKDFEYAAAHIINNSDTQAFEALIEQSDFLFDFIKRNVEKRLSNAINQNNYKNLLNFLKTYSYDYEDVIVSSLVKFADEDLTDEMLELLENGTNEQKAYSAKYFSKVNDTLSIELLRKYADFDFDPLAQNCAQALGAMKDEESYKSAIEKLSSSDEFEKLSAVRFLISYNDKKALSEVFKAMKKSSMPEHIASEIPYLQDFSELLNTDFKNDTLLALNYVINGLGEIIGLSQVFNFQLFEILESASTSDSKNSLLLLNAKQKFEQLTENEEYIFDESKDTKEEIYAIKNMLNSKNNDFWTTCKTHCLQELNSQSDFVFFALELVQELNIVDSLGKLKELLNSENQTLILKTLEVIKHLGKLDEVNKEDALAKVSDSNIKVIIQSL